MPILQVHVSSESQVADHCLKFALSDGAHSHYESNCNHDHNQLCDRCFQLNKVTL